MREQSSRERAEDHLRPNQLIPTMDKRSAGSSMEAAIMKEKRKARGAKKASGKKGEGKGASPRMDDGTRESARCGSWGSRPLLPPWR